MREDVAGVQTRGSFLRFCAYASYKRLLMTAILISSLPRMDKCRINMELKSFCIGSKIYGKLKLELQT